MIAFWQNKSIKSIFVLLLRLTTILECSYIAQYNDVVEGSEWCRISIKLSIKMSIAFALLSSRTWRRRRRASEPRNSELLFRSLSMERGQNYIGYCHVNIIVSWRVGEWVLCVAVACLSTMCTNLLIVQSTELEQLSLLRSQLSMKKTTMAALIAHQQGQPTSRLPDGWMDGRKGRIIHQLYTVN